MNLLTGASLLALAKSIYYGVNRLIFRLSTKSFQICMRRPGLRDVYSDEDWRPFLCNIYL